MSITHYNWTSEHPRFVVDLNGDGRADVVGIGPDCVWSCLNQSGVGFAEPKFALVAFEANAGWRVRDHSRYVIDVNGSGRADIIGFGDAGVWVAIGNGDGGFQEAHFVLQNFGFNQGWRVDKHPRFLADLTGDGRADIVGFGDAGVWIAIGNGDGTFQPAQFVLSNLGANTGWRVDDHPRFVVDVDGDGKPDLVGFGDDGLWVACNNGNGTFRDAQFVLADFGRGSHRDLVVRKEVVRDHRARDRIKHVFVLMLENRSYDHMLGFSELGGTDAATGQPTTADGLKATEFNCHAGKRFFVSRGTPDITVAPGHNFNAMLEQLCGPRAAFPNGGPYPEVNNTGFVSSLAHEGYGERGGEVMQCVAPERLPILTTLAREFAVCDRWFCSIPGPTEPNRMFLSAATSGDFDDSPSNREVVEASVTPGGGFEFEGGTIFDALDKADIKKRIYAGDHFPVVGELDGVSNTFDVRDFEDFAKDLQDRDFDAAFIHIEPNYFGGVLNTGDFVKGNSQHPIGGIAAGERLIKATYEAIRNSPHWESSMLIVTYDEHGGFYDHVAPGPADPTGSKGRRHGFNFDRLGPRVPAVVISPFIPKNTIEHRLLEHCSIIKTLMDLFDVPALRHARDLRGICGLLHLAHLSEPRQDTPARLPEVVVSDVPAAPSPTGAARHLIARHLPAAALPISDQDSMIATAVRVAAIENIALEPNRKTEIVNRVASLTTRADAAAFLGEVEAKIKASRPH